MGQTFFGLGIACVPGFYEPAEAGRDAFPPGSGAGTQSQRPVEGSHKGNQTGEEAICVSVCDGIVGTTNKMTAEITNVATEPYERSRQQKRSICGSQDRSVDGRQFPDERVAIALEVGTQSFRNGPFGGQLERPRIDSLLSLPDFIM
jgi:hypothetical protein